MASLETQGYAEASGAKPVKLGRPDNESNASALAEIDFGALKQSLGYQLRRVQLANKKHFVRLAGNAGIQPSQVGAMFVIGLNPGITSSALAAALDMDAAQISTMLSTLELRRLATRRQSRTDSRSRQLRLTAAGVRAFEELQSLVSQVEESFVADALSPDEYRLLVSLLSRLATSQDSE